jgi:integrase
MAIAPVNVRFRECSQGEFVNCVVPRGGETWQRERLGIGPRAKWTPHDLRRTAATLARRHGVPREHVQALLAHTEGDVTAVYDQYDMLLEKRLAVTTLGNAVAALPADR